MNKKHSFMDGVLRGDPVEGANNTERIKPIQSTVDKKWEDTSQENKKSSFVDRLLGEEIVEEIEESERRKIMRANEPTQASDDKKQGNTHQKGERPHQSSSWTKKIILTTLLFCFGIFALILGMVLFSMGGNRWEIIPGSIVIGLGIWSLKWSLTNGLTSLLKIIKPKPKSKESR